MFQFNFRYQNGWEPVYPQAMELHSFADHYDVNITNLLFNSPTWNNYCLAQFKSSGNILYATFCFGHWTSPSWNI